MIAIPNMDKPKSCGECSFFILDGAITDENEWVSYSICDLLDKTIVDADMLNDCPLIDIVTCGECKYAKFKIEDAEYVKCKITQLFVNKSDFCPDGERRNE